MTLPRAYSYSVKFDGLTERDKLIAFASSNLAPVACVLLYLSEPARSTKFSFPALIFYFPDPSCSTLSILKMTYISGLSCFNIYGEYGVTARRIFVHRGLSYLSVLHTSEQHLF